MKRLFKKETSVQERLSQVNSNANIAKRLNNAMAVTSGSLNQMFQTTATTSASSNNAAALNAEFIPVELASVKFTPPPQVLALN
jgi:hypothetical protein